MRLFQDRFILSYMIYLKELKIAQFLTVGKEIPWMFVHGTKIWRFCSVNCGENENWKSCCRNTLERCRNNDVRKDWTLLGISEFV